MTWLLGFNCEPHTAIATLHPYDGTGPYVATGEGRKTFELSDATTPGWGGDLFVEAAGYKRFKESRFLAMPQFDEAVILEPATGELPALHVEGLDFITSAGQRHVIVGSTELMLARRYEQEGADGIRPVLAERQRLGFNNLRALWQKDVGNTGHDLWQMPVEKMPRFLALAAEYSLYIQGTILADCQGQQDEAAQQRRVATVREATAGISNLIEQLGNEYDKNGHDPRHFGKPIDRLAANSSSTQGGRDAPYWDFFCFSGQRYPLNHAIREYGPIEFMYGDGRGWGGIPAICDEGMKPGVNSSDPRDFERAGAQTRSGCGGRFHSVAGTSGNSCLFSDFEKECAAAFVRGIGLS